MRPDVRGEMEVDFELPTTRRGKPREIGVHLGFWTESRRGWRLIGGKVWTEEGVRLSAREKRQVSRMARAVLPRLTWPVGERKASPDRPPSGPHASPLHEGLSSLARSDSTGAAEAMARYQVEADKEWDSLKRQGDAAIEEAQKLAQAGDPLCAREGCGHPLIEHTCGSIRACFCETDSLGHFCKCPGFVAPGGDSNTEGGGTP